MAYTKQYSKTTWVNNEAPPINASNLNKIEEGIDNVDSGLVEVEQSLTVRMDALEDEVDALDAAKVDATGVTAGYVPTADGQDGWDWAAQSGGGLTDGIKQALLQIAQKVAYVDEHGQDYYDDLYDALYAVTAISVSPTFVTLQTIGGTQQLTATTIPSGATVTWASSNTAVATVDSTGLVTSVGYGSATITATAGQMSATCAVVVAQATVTSIDAVYTQSGTVYDTDSLDSLKDDLVVTAHWSNGTTSTVASADYTLSGTLAEGTSTVTVSYGGQTDTFDVTVSVDTHGWINDVYTLTSDDFVQGQIQAQYPYYVSKNNRISYIGTDVDCDMSAYSYTITYTTTRTDSTNIGVQSLSAEGLRRVLNGEQVDQTNSLRVDSGWVNSGYQLADQNAVALWFTFRAGNGSTAIVPSDFPTVIITRTRRTRTLLYNWDFTQSLVDTEQQATAVLSAYADDAPPTQNANGLTFNAQRQQAYLGNVMANGRTVEIDVANFEFAGSTDYNIRFIMLGNGSNTPSNGPLIWRHNNNIGWSAYSGAWSNSVYGDLSGSSTDILNYFDGKTIKIKLGSSGNASLYVDGVEIGTSNVTFNLTHLYIGSVDGNSMGGQLYNVTITGLRVYEGD